VTRVRWSGRRISIDYNSSGPSYKLLVEGRHTSIRYYCRGARFTICPKEGVRTTDRRRSCDDDDRSRVRFPPGANFIPNKGSFSKRLAFSYPVRVGTPFFDFRAVKRPPLLTVPSINPLQSEKINNK
jgi:hypothetical protein